MGNFNSYKETIASAFNETKEGKKEDLPKIEEKIKNINSQNKKIKNLLKEYKNNKTDIIKNPEAKDIFPWETNGEYLYNKLQNLFEKNNSHLKALNDLRKDIKEGLNKNVIKNFSIDNLDIFYYNNFSIETKKGFMSVTKDLSNNPILKASLNKEFNKKLKNNHSDKLKISSYIEFYTGNNPNSKKYNLAIIDGKTYEFEVRNNKVENIIESKNFELDKNLKILYKGNSEKIDKVEKENKEVQKGEKKEKKDDYKKMRSKVEKFIKKYFPGENFNEKASFDIGEKIAEEGVKPKDFKNFLLNLIDIEKENKKYLNIEDLVDQYFYVGLKNHKFTIEDIANDFNKNILVSFYVKSVIINNNEKLFSLEDKEFIENLFTEENLKTIKLDDQYYGFADPKKIKKFLDTYGDLLSPKQKTILERKLDKLIHPPKAPRA